MNRKPYTYAERLAIETMLNENHTIKEIEKDIKRNSSGITKEINKNTIYRFPSFYAGHCPCLKWNDCPVKSFECYLTCKNIEYKICPKLSNSPHVCNGCTTKSSCRYVKKYYCAREAHEAYKAKLSDSRIGLHYTEREKTILNDILCPLIIKSKSVYHAVNAVNSTYQTNFISKTIYWQTKKEYLPIKSSDLPRSRKRNRTKENNKDKSYKRNIENHTYDDYDKYKKENQDACETQMDTVEGIKENNAPVILTLEIVPINFLFMFKIDNQTIDKVVEKLIYLKDEIEQESFDKIMKILLTDNGKEFIDMEKINSVSSNINLFYCHSYSSFEKGSIENNHELIRRVIPKGVSLKPYTQLELNLLCSHINSLFRESLNGKCPFDLINDYIPIDKINKLGLKQINPFDVCLNPELLGDKNIDNIKKYLDKNDIEKANIKFLND